MANRPIYAPNSTNASALTGPFSQVLSGLTPAETTIIPLGTAVTTSTGTLALTAVTQIPLGTTAAISDATLTLTVPIGQIVRAAVPLPQVRLPRTQSQLVGGLIPAKNLSPAGLARTRALGAATIIDARMIVKARGVATRSRALRPSRIVRAPTVTNPAGLARTRALGAPYVSPGIIRPAGQVHERLIGSPSLATTLIQLAGLDHGANYPGNGYPEPGSYPGSIRSLGDPTVSTAQTQTVRHLGDGLSVSVAWHPRPAGLVRTRALGAPVAHGRSTLTPVSVTRARFQGNPTLSAWILMTGLARTRALGAPSVNPWTISPAALSHTRAQGAHTITVVKIIRPVAIVLARAIGSPTVRGRLTLSPTGLTRTRAQGAPKLSGRALPLALTHTRTLGVPAVNAIAPAALARA